MKKLILTAVAAICTIVAANANNNILGILNVGARIGIISSSEHIPTSSAEITDAIKAEGTGWTGTVFARVNIPKLPFYLQPELQYTNTTIKLPSVDLDAILGNEKEEEVETHRYIDLPILLGFEFGLGSLANVRVNAGPVFAISSEKGFKDLTEDDFIGAYKEPKVSWTAGLGVKLLSFIAEVRYNGNFTNGEVNTEDLAGSIDPNRTSWNLSIGVVF